jgi:hypothetical protein
MNERIKELAEHAKIYMGQDSYGKFAVIPGHEKGSINRQGKAEAFDALEKFAELIVRECGTVINSENYRGHSKGWNDAIEWADGMIKENFGVK